MKYFRILKAADRLSLIDSGLGLDGISTDKFLALLIQSYTYHASRLVIPRAVAIQLSITGQGADIQIGRRQGTWTSMLIKDAPARRVYISLYLPMRFSRRKASPWEVVDYKAVHPVTGYLNDDDELGGIMHVSEADLEGTYLFEVKDGAQYTQRALVFARQQLLIASSKKGYNALLLEGWDVTTFRKGAKRRVEVKYRARPALSSRDIPGRLPPFMGLVTSKLY